MVSNALAARGQPAARGARSAVRAPFRTLAFREPVRLPSRLEGGRPAAAGAGCDARAGRDGRWRRGGARIRALGGPPPAAGRIARAVTLRAANCRRRACLARNDRHTCDAGRGAPPAATLRHALDGAVAALPRTRCSARRQARRGAALRQRLEPGRRLQAHREAVGEIRAAHNHRLVVRRAAECCVRAGRRAEGGASERPSPLSCLLALCPFASKRLTRTSVARFQVQWLGARALGTDGLARGVPRAGPGRRRGPAANQAARGQVPLRDGQGRCNGGGGRAWRRVPRGAGGAAE